jgi:glycosyltransferase involved in cell wall biosynthesis
MRVCYLLEDTALFGGVKVVLRQANLLAAAGHEVVVASKGPRPDWIDLECEFQEVPVFEPGKVPNADVTVATYWTTILPAMASASGEVVHYCQGFEASYTHNVAEHPLILESYAQPLPGLCVAPHLSTLLEKRFSRPSRVVVQPLEPIWQPATDGRRLDSEAARVLVVGPFEIDWKGVATALHAVRELRARGLELRLVRLSQWPLTEDERKVLEPDEFHCHVPPTSAADVVRSCDLMIAPSWEAEGFGLPVLEAMASGVPVVASDISAFRDFAEPAAVLVPGDSPDGFVRAAAELLGDEQAWRQARKSGLEIAQRFSVANATLTAVHALDWVAGGAWRAEIASLVSRKKKRSS